MECLGLPRSAMILATAEEVGEVGRGDELRGPTRVACSVDELDRLGWVTVLAS